MEKAVIYARVSSEEQAKHGFSIENQKKVCVEFAQKSGFVVDKIFVDEGKSAKNLDRPEIQELMTYCGKKKNNIKALVIWRLDRISRNTTDYHGVLRPLFERKGIKLLSATEANVDTIEGDLMRNIGMSFAEYERKIIGFRTIAGLRQKASQGEYPHQAPVGYKNITREDGSKAIAIDEKNAFYVKRAFEMYDSGMYSLRSLTNKLYEDGFRTKKGKKVAKTTIEYMLKNIIYTGVFKFEDKIYENAKHKPIISKELFYRVQDRLIDPNKTRKHNIDFAYTGLIRCEHCGCLLTAELKKGKYIYYHCTGNKGGNCKRDYINETKIDKAIAEVLKLIIIPSSVRLKIELL
ncbi:TPA: recombinase family protein [Candidatus Scatousia excrementigallinarum]|uniref:Recombinase family protein n=1 Tax=Candidatus Scatousia excrementigallinarum TaxID=2840935 RepID=A0A9D1EWQ5_9BACT|nr:recombinase family protein [Candidatus Scatousia excrementigallinarum]